MEEDIKKIFEIDAREKKRIGANIFRRASTRRGGTNMSTMRVPTQKEQKLLSGEVKVYSMKDIISYEELIEKDQEEQKRLLEFWRNNYKSAEIQKGLGIDKNVYYRLINDLGIKKKDMGHVTKETLSEDDLKKYYDDNENFINFMLFKKIVSWQQQFLFEKYLNRCGSIQALHKEWKGSKLNTLYYISSKIGKEEKVESPVATEPITEEQTIEVETAKTEMTKPIVTPVSQELQEWRGDQPDVFIHYRTKELRFNYEGSYNKETVIKRLKMMMEEIEASEGDLKVTLTITEKEGAE